MYGKPAITCFKYQVVLYGLTRFRRTSDGEVIPGPEHGFDIVGGYFSADLFEFGGTVKIYPGKT